MWSQPIIRNNSVRSQKVLPNPKVIVPGKMSSFKSGGNLSRLFYQHFLCLLYFFWGKTNKQTKISSLVCSPSFMYLHKHANQIKILCLYLSFGQKDKGNKERKPSSSLSQPSPVCFKLQHLTVGSLIRPSCLLFVDLKLCKL